MVLGKLFTGMPVPVSPSGICLIHIEITLSNSKLSLYKFSTSNTFTLARQAERQNQQHAENIQH